MGVEIAKVPLIPTTSSPGIRPLRKLDFCQPRHTHSEVILERRPLERGIPKVFGRMCIVKTMTQLNQTSHMHGREACSSHADSDWQCLLNPDFFFGYIQRFDDKWHPFCRLF